MSGFERNRGKSGTPRTHPSSSKFLGKALKIRVMRTLNPKSVYLPSSCASELLVLTKSHPGSSFILKVKAAEIVNSGSFRRYSERQYIDNEILSDLYHIGYTMRFPRALHIREDLSVADCMTVSGGCYRSTSKNQLRNQFVFSCVR